MNNIYNYLKYKYDHSEKDDLWVGALLCWLTSWFLGMVLGVIWEWFGLVFFLVWGTLGVAGFLAAIWYVSIRILKQSRADYDHYISEFGKHKNKDNSSDEQMTSLGDLFEEHEEIKEKPEGSYGTYRQPSKTPYTRG